MVAVVDDAHTLIKVLAQNGGIGRVARNTWIVLVDGGVVVGQKVGADVLNVLPVVFVKVTGLLFHHFLHYLIMSLILDF